MSQPYQLWIAGQDHPGSGDLIPIEDPSTGQIFAQ